MTTIRHRWLLASVTALAGTNLLAQPSASPIHLSVLLGSDYKQSGLSQTGSEPVLRFAVDYEHATGFFAGGFVANAEYAADRNRASERDTQANLYAGYSWRGARWSSNVFVTRYFYPGFSPSYDYTDTTLGTSYRDRYFLSYSRSNDFYSLGQHTDQFRGGLVLPWIKGLEVGVNAGEYRTRGAFDTDYSFWDAGLSRVLGRFAVDLRYHDNTYDRASVIGEDGDDRWVLSISYAISPGDRDSDRR